ncbi:D-alanine--D-alanine ligase family protein [Erysipelothrix urinaevulpis]|uniref:D-alanine--D-alanine ligase family protein n=1 Tax=Erysipelothrix urinaevulpis TaxID=2683717 RepID=UPI001357A003|nr:D-alanine--D-alanine ligase family protein [Erysipelothrix urinaevulpis]
MKKNIALIFGSMDSEHDVSVASAASVYENFPHDDYNCQLIYIGQDGKWYHGLYTLDEMTALKLENHEELYLRFDQQSPGFYNVEKNEKLTIDGAFLMLHGKTGEGGYVQGLLALAHIPFTGCNLLSSALCMDKAYTHIICEHAGIPMAQYQLISSFKEVNHTLIAYPCIVKPSREGSSFGVSYVKTAQDLEKAINVALEFDDRVLIEEYIDGTEVGMSILDTKEGRIISEVDQVNVSGEVFDFQEKYHPHNTETLKESLFPKIVLDEIKEMGSKVFDALYCDQFSRLDFFVTKNNEIYFNEVNTIPGFTANSRYPKMMENVGVDYTDLIQRLIEDSLC